METVKSAFGLAGEALKTHPLAVMLACFVLVIMPGIVKLASMLPHVH